MAGRGMSHADTGEGCALDVTKNRKGEAMNNDEEIAMSVVHEGIAYENTDGELAPRRIKLSHDMPVPCIACHKPMVTGETILLLVIGPGDDEEERARCRAWKPYTAVSVPVHFACVTGNEP